MNAIVSLCHFCDQHGPCVLFSTQTYKGISEGIDNTNEVRRWKFGYVQNWREHHCSPKICESCESVPANEALFVANDDENKISYVSSRLPLLSQARRDVELACTRSLSCESGPYKGSVFYFGDETRGYVVTYPFYLQDANARGKKRLFSLLVFMRDEIYLLNLWDFFLTFFGKLKNWLQGKAQAVYMKENQELCPTLDPDRIPQACNIRSLSKIIDVGDTWTMMHYQFNWILLAASKKNVEVLFQGTAIESTVPNLEDYTFLRQLVLALSDRDLKILLHTIYNGYEFIIDRNCSIPPLKIRRAFQFITPNKLLSYTIIGDVLDDINAYEMFQRKQDIQKNGVKGKFKTGLLAKKIELQPSHAPRGLFSLEVTTTAQVCEEALPPNIVNDMIKLLRRCDFTNFARDVSILFDDWKQKSRLWTIAQVRRSSNVQINTSYNNHSYYGDYMMADNIALLAKENFSVGECLNAERRLKTIGASAVDLELLSKWASVYGYSRFPSSSARNG